MQLSDAQIDFIQRDIEARGITIPQLSDSLLDHICCCMENDPDSTGDFETLYHKHLRRFYTKELWEIEEEALLLILYKNYYTMKKITIISGLVSTLSLIIGVILKFMFAPGAAFFIITGILLFSFIFLPLFFTVKLREKTQALDKLVLFLGSLSGFMIVLHIWFKVMHYPGVNITGLTALIVLLGLFLPLYLYTGIRNPQTKSNAVITSILVVAGSALFFVPYRTPKVTEIQNNIATTLFLNSEEILKSARIELSKLRSEQAKPEQNNLTQTILNTCEEIKTFILTCETGRAELDRSFASKDAYIRDTHVGHYFDRNPEYIEKVNVLTACLDEYQKKNTTRAGTYLFDKHALIELIRFDKSVTALNVLTQIEFLVIQQERELLAKR